MAQSNLPTPPDVVSVPIPAEYVADFRAALVYEIRFEAECIIDHAKRDEPDERTILERLDKPDDVEVSYGDVRVDAKLMSHDAALLDQLSDVPSTGSVPVYVPVPEGLDALPHAFEAMAREVVGPRLKQALGVGPIDRGWLPKIKDQMERVAWAVERAAEYHDKAGEARKQEGGRA